MPLESIMCGGVKNSLRPTRSCQFLSHARPSSACRARISISQAPMRRNLRSARSGGFENCVGEDSCLFVLTNNLAILPFIQPRSFWILYHPSDPCRLQLTFSIDTICHKACMISSYLRVYI